ncbi:hypothetical protein [uncultured Methylobacterium sp.]|uniref:hypothetical protein n=1 Tax=uncultured Methylobacterium sp. TaxID=157278 RepID=UPI00259426E0|nr:hypothetical protein [uncultured Methylobacterium sp.]
MDQPYLYEFLYRGRPAGSTEAPAWHVIVGQQVTLPGASEAQFVTSGALTPAQAEAAGFPLSAVLDGIDAAALAGRDAAVADAEAARTDAETARRERDAALAEAQAAGLGRDAAVAERDVLAAQLASLKEQVARSAEPPAPSPQG